MGHSQSAFISSLLDERASNSSLYITEKDASIGVAL